MNRSTGCLWLSRVAALLLLLLWTTPSVAVAGVAAGGGSHTLVIKTTDGTVWAWGANNYNQLGDNTTTLRPTPVQVSGLTGVVSVAAGWLHSLALKSDGTLWAWGYNYYGQLGNGNNNNQPVPVQVLTNVSAIAAGQYFSIALKTDGTIWTWGFNSDGALGDGGTTHRNTPGQVTGLGLVSAVGAGSSALHSLAILGGGGGLKAWGKNGNGQLGDGGTYTSATNPVTVINVEQGSMVAGGFAFSVARTATGALWAWGNNSYGQLGLGDSSQRPTPTQLPTTTGASLAVGGYHVLDLLANGTVLAWGYNAYGAVGDGTGTSRTTAVPVPGLSSVIAVAAGDSHSIAVTSSGEVWAWGGNGWGQVGDGTSQNRLSPVKIAEAGFNWKAATPTMDPAPGTYTVSANRSVTLACSTTGATIRYTLDGTDPDATSPVYTTTLYLTSSTTVKARASKAGLADSAVAGGVYNLKVATPGLSPGGSTYTTAPTVTMSTNTTGATLRYTTDGSIPDVNSAVYTGPLLIPTTTTLKVAGFKDGWLTSDVTTATYTMNFGTLPAPTFDPPAGMYTDSAAISISAVTGSTIRYTTNGSDPSTSSTLYTSPIPLAQTTTLKAKAWRVDYTTSATTTATYTIKVAAPLLDRVGGTYPAGTTVTVTGASGASIRYTLTGVDPVDTDPQIASGASLVLGNYTLKLRAFRMGCDPSDIVSATYTVTGHLSSGAVAAGSSFSLALLPDGLVYSWGQNAYGALGDGKGVDRAVPAPIPTLTGIRGIAAGGNHALAITSAGTVVSWGFNLYGQLGDSSTTQRTTPVPVQNLTDVVAVAAGWAMSAALKSDGSLWMWGFNDQGQVGAGDTITPKKTPVQVLTQVAEVALGWNHVIARRTDGTIWSWGINAQGQLGNNSTANRSTPAQVAGLSGVVGVAAGQYHSFARLAGGQVYGWGDNSQGQLGEGGNTSHLTPTLNPLLSDLVSLDGGGWFSLAAGSDGLVRASGWNDRGPLGDGTTNTKRYSPVLPSGPTGVVQVSGGDYHSLALTSDGSIWAWGNNDYGRVGDGTTTDRLTPVQIRFGSSWLTATPALNPNGGNYTWIRTVTVTDATPGATIRYTTNGADPTTSDTVVASGGTVTVGQSLTLKAKAWKVGLADSNVATAAFTLTVATPTISGGGTFNTPQTVTISCSVAGAVIRYTTNGVDPTPADTQIASGGTITVAQTQVLKAKAWLTGWTESAVAVQNFTMVVGTPAFSPVAGAYSIGQAITITTVTPSAALHYTTSGVEPTLTDPVVASGGSIVLNNSMTLKVKGWRAGWTESATALANYFALAGTAAAPVFTPAAGTFSTPQSVTITSATQGAVIRYTLDGTQPAMTSAIYAGPLSIQGTTTLTARVYKLDWLPSPSTAGTYVVQGTSATTPVISPAGGTVAAGQTVRISSAEAGATIRYTTDGHDPTDTSTAIASGASITVGRSMRVKALAWKAGLEPSAVAVADFNVVGAAAAGERHTVVLKSDGTLAAWGDNANGQLGDGSTTQRRTPVPVTGLTNVVAVSCGQYHTLALKADGTVWAWGYSLGTGASGDRSTPTQVLEASQPLSGVVAIAAGLVHSLALKADGTVWAWGYNAFGALGDGTSNTRSRAAIVPGLSGITAIASHASHSLALQTGGGATGSVWAWGPNDQGQLGDGSTVNRLSPVKVAEQVVHVTGGAVQTLILKADGSVWGAGFNDRGQLGNGTLNTPQTVFGPAFVGAPNIVKLSASGVHSLALTTGGEVWATGNNNMGQLGDGAATDTSQPVRSVFLEDVMDVAAGAFSPSVWVSTNTHSVAITADGRVWTWGSNYYGTLGSGGGVNDARLIPQPVAGISASDQSWPEGDADNDGLTNAEELSLGTDPFNADTNGDGILDQVAVRAGISATSPDVDGDGVSNVTERQRGMNPLSADTDGDGVADGIDCFPLDPARAACLSPVPGDVTPPDITLIEPTSAVLVSSTP